jgi:hypothetical protein
MLISIVCSSGLKKNYIAKNRFMTTTITSSLILRYNKGNKHCYDIYKKNHPLLLNKLLICSILYLGVKNDFTNYLLSLLNNKKRSQHLYQKEVYDKRYSEKRIVTEHINYRIKKILVMYLETK